MRDWQLNFDGLKRISQLFHSLCSFKNSLISRTQRPNKYRANTKYYKPCTIKNVKKCKEWLFRQ